MVALHTVTFTQTLSGVKRLTSLTRTGNCSSCFKIDLSAFELVPSVLPAPPVSQAARVGQTKTLGKGLQESVLVLDPQGGGGGPV